MLLMKNSNMGDDIAHYSAELAADGIGITRWAGNRTRLNLETEMNTWERNGVGLKKHSRSSLMRCITV